MFGSLPFDILINDIFTCGNNSFVTQYYCTNTFDEVSRAFFLLQILSLRTAGKEQEPFIYLSAKAISTSKIKIYFKDFYSKCE